MAFIRTPEGAHELRQATHGRRLGIRRGRARQLLAHTPAQRSHHLGRTLAFLILLLCVAFLLWAA